MSVQVLLASKKPAVVDRWLDLLLADYPPETARFLKGQGDRFANPVGSTFREAIAGLYEELMGPGETERSRDLLDRIVRIRAVQGMPPSRALAFIPGLKRLLREALGEPGSPAGGPDGGGALSPREWHELDERIDRLSLLAFDLYLGCREKIHEIRFAELRNRTHLLLERAGLVAPVPEGGGEAGGEGEG